MNLFEFPERRPVYKNKSLIPNTPDAFGSADAFFGRKQESVIPTMGAYAPSKAPLGKTPKVYNPEIPLFSDEQKMLQRMKADNLSDEQAYGMLKQRRTDLLGGSTKIGADEKQILMKMQADNLSAKEATNMIQQRRYDKEKESFNKAYESGNLAQKGAYNLLAGAAGNLETIATYGGNLLDFATFGKLGFGDEVKKMKEVTQAPQFQESTAFKAGTYLPDVALAVSPIGGGYMAGAKGMTGLQGANLFSKVGLKNASQGLMARSGVVGAGFGATQPIFEKGSDATMGDIASGAGYGAVAGAVSAPVFGKAFKYGQAGYYGGATGIGKSITRDVKGAGQTIKNIGTAIAPKGANISTRANRFNALDEQKFIQATGQTPGEFATTRGMTKVGDDAVVEATNAWQASKAQADEAFGAIEGNFRIGGDKDFINGAIEGLQGKLSKYSPEIERVNQLATKYQNEGLTMSEVNELKRLYSANHKYSFLDSGSKQAIESRDIQDGLRTWQFKVAEQNGLSNIAEINKNTQAWKMYADSLAKKLNRGVANNANTLTDWIVLGGGNPENIALYLGKKLASSDLTKRTAIKLFSKQTKPSIIKPNIAEIQQSNFQKNVNRGISSNRDNSGGESMVRVAGLLPEPTGKSSGAKNFRVNQPKETSGYKNDTQVGKRPTGSVKTENTVLNIAKESASQKTMKSIKETIASEVKQARFGGVGETRVQSTIESNLLKGKITIEEAKQIVEDILDSVTKGERTYPYTTKKGLETYLEKLYSSNYKIDGADLFEIPVKKVTPKKITPTEKVEPKKVKSPTKTTVNLQQSKGGFIRLPEIGKKSEGIKVYKGVNGEGTGKKFPLDYFTTDKKSASQYGKEVIETTIYPKKIADFTNPSNKAELRKILRDNLNPKVADEFIDRAMEGKDSFSYPLYEMVENPKVTQALKDAGYDATKYLDYGNKNSKFARHETIAMLDVKPIKKTPVNNPLVEEARKLKDKDLIASLIKDTNLEKSVTNPTYIKMISSKFESEYNNIISGVMKNDMTSIEGLKRLKALQEKYKNTKADFTIKKGFGFSEDTKAVDAIKKSIRRIEDTIKWEDKIRKQ